MKTVSKEEAARRQLNAAIELFLSGGDLLAVFNLASAVLILTENLNAREGLEKDTLFQLVKKVSEDEEFKAFKLAMGKKPGFLKHGDRKEDDINDVAENEALAQLVAAAQNFQAVFGYATTAMNVICSYFLISLAPERARLITPLDGQERLNFILADMERYGAAVYKPELLKLIQAERLSGKTVSP